MVVFRTLWTFPCVALAVFLVLSGCTEPVVPTAVLGDFDVATCSIEGFVMDEQFNPLDGALVGLLDVEPIVKAITAGGGRFSFTFLPPGIYNVSASKTV